MPMRRSISALGLCAVVALVPASSALAHPHTVEPGETLWSISVVNGQTPRAVAEANGLAVDAPLHPGATVEIPAAPSGGITGGNGRLDPSSLTPIHSPLGPASLESEAAQAWQDMREASVAELGVDLYPSGSRAAYRTFDEQETFYAEFQAGTGPLAAPPGGSAHGEGRAVDLASQEMRRAVDSIGARFGWAKVEAGPAEWFHVNYVGR